MRIIAGQRRGHKFEGPDDGDTRPTSDLVRESIFNILGPSIEGLDAFDLFAGTGALGLEALSRGAARATFIELDRGNVALIRRNIATLRYEDRTAVHRGDAHRWARSLPGGEAPVVVFLDPPYLEYENHPTRVRRTLEGLLEKLPEGSTLVVESRKSLDASVLPDLHAWDVRRYGGTQVALRAVTREAPVDDTPSDPLLLSSWLFRLCIRTPHSLLSRHPMNPDPRRSFAASVVTRLREAGHEAYWAGGCVRDLLLGLAPSDYDVATSARPEQVMTLFRRTVGVGVSFGVVRVLGPPELGDVEVATFRSDGAYIDGRRPESVVFSTAEQDASRRDFTINGMFLDPVDDRVIDFVGGRDDLERRILRAIGDPSARFSEDKLRLLRAVRFAARFGLTIDPATRSAVESMAAQVTAVSAERIAQELRRMLVHPSRSTAMDLALRLGVLRPILPFVADLPSPEDRASWPTTLRVLDALPDAPSFPLAFAALHRGVGRASTLEQAASLKLSNAERDRIGWLVENESALTDAAGLPRHRLKRLLASDGIDDLLALHRARAVATTGDVAHVAYCEAYLRDRPDGPIGPPPLLTGHDLIRHGLRPGPGFAAMLEAVRDAQLDGRRRRYPR